MLVVAAVACSGGEAAPDPGALVESAADHLVETEGFTFRISREGEPVELGGWLIRALDGEFEAPASADSRVKIALAGIIVEVGIVSIDDTTWQQDPLSGAWQRLDPGSSVAVAGVFGPDGLAAVIRNDLSRLVFVETTELATLPGEELHHITASLDAARLERISAGLMPSGITSADLYFAENGELRRIVIPDSGGSWTIDAWAYGPGYHVEPPE